MTAATTATAAATVRQRNAHAEPELVRLPD
jgi:hypothetical protein